MFGQKINFSKSHIMFNKHVSLVFKDHVSKRLEMPYLGNEDVYLGILFTHSCKQKQIFQPLLHKLHSKIESWQRSSLSKAGRLVMIKLVLQSLQLISCLRIPQTIYTPIDQNFRKFYWGEGQQMIQVH